jgi:hypothetical protein
MYDLLFCIFVTSNINVIILIVLIDITIVKKVHTKLHLMAFAVRYEFYTICNNSMRRRSVFNEHGRI